MNKTRKSLDAKIPAKFVASVLAGHSTLGLTFAALIYIVCFSGTVAVFANELLRWERPAGPVVTAATPALIGQTAKAAYARASSLGPVDELFLQLPTDDLPRLLIQATSAESGTEAWLADENGVLTAQEGIPWWQFLIGLHVRLLVPGLWGLILVGLDRRVHRVAHRIGRARSSAHFQGRIPLRWGGSRRLQEADLHNRLSVWGLPFHLTIALSGAVLALAPFVVNLIVETTYRGDTSKVLPRNLRTRPRRGSSAGAGPRSASHCRRAIAHLSRRERLKRSRLQNVATAGQLVHVLTKRPGQLNLSERHFFDSDGKLLRTAGYDDGPAGIQWTAAMTALHYGWFGGWFVKLAYGVLGAALTIVAATGVNIWLARWSDKGRIRRVWQRDMDGGRVGSAGGVWRIRACSARGRRGLGCNGVFPCRRRCTRRCVFRERQPSLVQRFAVPGRCEFARACRRSFDRLERPNGGRHGVGDQRRRCRIRCADDRHGARFAAHSRPAESAFGQVNDGNALPRARAATSSVRRRRRCSIRSRRPAAASCRRRFTFSPRARSSRR